MKLLAASLASILTVLLLNLGIILVPALIAGAPIYWNQFSFIGFWVLLVATIIVVLIGIPIYLLLKHYAKASKNNLAISGFIVPMIVVTFINIFFSPSGNFTAGQNYHGTYREMIVEGERTIWGWLSVLEQGIILGICGAIAAAVFGLTVERLSLENKQA